MPVTKDQIRAELRKRGLPIPANLQDSTDPIEGARRKGKQLKDAAVRLDEQKKVGVNNTGQIFRDMLGDPSVVPQNVSSSTAVDLNVPQPEKPATFDSTLDQVDSPATIGGRFSVDENRELNESTKMVTGSDNPLVPSSSTSTTQYPEGFRDERDEVDLFFQSITQGSLEGLTGLDLSDPSDERLQQNIGMTVGQVSGFLGSFAIGGAVLKGGGTGLRLFAPAFRKLSPFGQKMVRQIMLGNTVEGIKQSMRGVAGQSVDLLEIPLSGAMFGGSEAALYGIGMLGKTIFRSSKNAIAKRALQEVVVESTLKGKASNLVTGIAKGFEDTVKRGLVQSANLLKTKPGKTIVELGRRTFDDISIREGKISTRLKEIGVDRIRRNERNLLSKLLEKTDASGVVDLSSFPKGTVLPELTEMAGKVRLVLNDMVGEAGEIGIKAGYLNNYLPRIMKKEMADIIYGDIRKKLKAIKGVLETDNVMSEGKLLSDRVLTSKLRKAIADARFGNTTEKAIKHLMTQGKMSRYKAIQILERESGDNLFSIYGNLERRRIVDLPGDFYESDVKVVLDRYTEGWARRLSEADNFGVSGEKAIKLLDQVQKIDPGESADARQVIQHILRITERTKGIENQTLKKMANGYVNFRVGTAIGLGFATVPNLTQTLISTMAKHGLYRTTKGFGSLLTKEGRREVSRSGSTWTDVHRMLIGETASGVTGTLNKYHPGLALFNLVNTGNKMLASSTARVAITDYYAAAQANSTSAALKAGLITSKLAKRRLSRLGIDWAKKLSDDDILRGMARFANDSQLMRNVLNEPLWFNNPKLRPFVLYKRFGYRQAVFVKDEILKEFMHGDPLPLIRLAAGGAVGGWAVQRARAELKELMSGEEQRSKSKDVISRVVDEKLLGKKPRKSKVDFWSDVAGYLAASGAMGTLTDLSDSFDSDNPVAELYDGLGFAVKPIIVDDMLKTTIALGGLLNSKRRDGFQKFSSKMIKQYGGSIGRYALGYRVETNRQRRSRKRAQSRRERGRR